MIGYYVHHQGAGHRARALQIARRLTSPVVGFSSLPEPIGWPGRWCRLPADHSDAPINPSAHGVLHWAPLGHRGHRARLGQIAEELAGALAAMVVDVSAEVALLARLFGVPTAVIALRGDRSDRTHQLAWDAADLIVAPWLAGNPEPGWPDHWTAKTVFGGPISRFDDRRVPPQPPVGRLLGGRVLVVWGAGGDLPDNAQLAAAREATPDWEWQLRSPVQPSPDLWRELLAADVVVTHGGDNAVAEVAAAGRSAVVIAQPRPFDEQLATTAALRRAGCCVATDGWPTPTQWPTLLAAATELGGGGWSRWWRGDGAIRAAAAIQDLAEPVAR